MPTAAPRPCRHPGCPALVPSGYCDQHKRSDPSLIAKAAADRKRPTARQRGYNFRWEKARKAWLAKHPLCEECKRGGHIRAATVVDHIIPHKGDADLFWDSENNWQSLCKTHHDAKTAKEDGRWG